MSVRAPRPRRKPSHARTAPSSVVPQALESRLMYSTQSLPAPSAGVNYGPAFRVALDKAYREAGPAVVNLAAGTYDMDVSRREWFFSSAADFSSFWTLTGATQTVASGLLTITPTAGVSSFSLTMKVDVDPLGLLGSGNTTSGHIDIDSAPTGLSVTSNRRFFGASATDFQFVQTKSVPTTGQVTPMVQSSNDSGRVINQVQFVFSKSGTFNGTEQVKIDSIVISAELSMSTYTPGEIAKRDFNAHIVAAIDEVSAATPAERKMLTVSGAAAGSTINRLSPYAGLFNATDTGNLSFYNFNVDSDRRPWAQGMITGVGSSTNVATGLTLYRYNVQLTGDELALLNDASFRNLAFENKKVGSTFYTTTSVSIREPTDLTLPKAGPRDISRMYFAYSTFPVVPAGSTLYTATVALDTPASEGVATGDGLVFYNRSGQGSVFRISGAGNAMDNSDPVPGTTNTVAGLLLLKNINVYRNVDTTFSGDSILGRIKFDDVAVQKITRADPDWISQCADGFHIKDLQYVSSGAADRSIEILSSRVNGNLDDCVALYQTGWHLAETRTTTHGGSTVSLLTLYGQAMPRVGDVVAFEGGDGTARGSGTVLEVTPGRVVPGGSTGTAIKLDVLLTGLDPDPSSDDLLADTGWNVTRNFQNWYVGASVFERNRGSGLTIRVGNGTVAGCTFRYNAGCGVWMGNLIATASVPVPTDVTIQNCTFLDNNRLPAQYNAPWGMGIGSIAFTHWGFAARAPGVTPTIRRITIKDNSITDYHRAAINLMGVDGVTITGNTISRDATTPNVPTYNGTAPILLRNAHSIYAADNTITDTHPSTDQAILVDPNYNQNASTPAGVPVANTSDFPLIGAGNVVSPTLALTNYSTLADQRFPNGSEVGSGSTFDWKIESGSTTNWSVPATGTYAQKLQWNTTSGEGLIRYQPGVSWTDFVAQASVRITSLVGTNGAGLTFRMTDTANMYVLYIAPGDNAGAGRLRLMRKSAGTWQTLATWNQPVVVNQDYRLTVFAEGDTFTPYLDNIPLAPYTDSSAQKLTSGGVGFRTFGAATVMDDVHVLGVLPDMPTMMRATGASAPALPNPFSPPAFFSTTPVKINLPGAPTRFGPPSRAFLTLEPDERVLA